MGIKQVHSAPPPRQKSYGLPNSSCIKQCLDLKLILFSGQC